MPGAAGGLFDSGAAAEHDEIGKRHRPLAGPGACVEFCLDRFQSMQHLGRSGGVVDLPLLLRQEAKSRPVGSPAFVAAAKRGCRGPRRGDQRGDGKTRCEDGFLEDGNIRGADHRL